MKKNKIVISELAIFHIRVIKISIAVFVTLIISTYLDVHKPILPALIAGLCIKPTFFGGIKYGLNELKVTFFSALYSIIFFEFAYLFLPHNDLLHIFVTTLVVTAVVTYCMSSKHYDLIPIAILTALYMSIENEGYGFLYASLLKKSSIFIGIIVATILNASFITFQYNEYLKKRLKEIANTTYAVFKETIESFIYLNSAMAEKSIDKIDKFLNYAYSIRMKIENIYVEMKIRKKITKFDISKILNLKKIVEIYILTLHHILNIDQALTIIVEELKQSKEDNKYSILFCKFEDSLLYISEILIDKFDIINRTIKFSNKDNFKNKQIEKIKEIDILFKGIILELQNTLSEDKKEFLIEMIAIGRNLKDIGTNLNKIELLLKELYT